jgi:hypothetical protein
MRSRRGLTIAVLACVAAAALVLFAASRVWAEVTITRVAPLPPTVARRTGSSLAPWLPALGVVALAGAGALLATRGLLRTTVGFLLVACGLGIVAVGVAPIGDAASPLWPVVCGLAGAVVAAAGALTAWAGRSWPAMGARYERASAPSVRHQPATQAALWDALDRGDDPTG